jgi:hypothetical protein
LKLSPCSLFVRVKMNIDIILAGNDFCLRIEAKVESNCDKAPGKGIIWNGVCILLPPGLRPELSDHLNLSYKILF